MKKYQLTIQEGTQRHGFVVGHADEQPNRYAVLFSTTEWGRFQQRLERTTHAQLDYAGHAVSIEGKPARMDEGILIVLRRLAARN
jgi:hypothetical protein